MDNERIVDVSSIRGAVKARVVENFRVAYPELDITAKSTLEDLLIEPIVDILDPVYQVVNKFEVAQDLRNAEYAEEDILDEYGSKNYFIKRRAGVKATIVVTISLVNLNSEDTVTVPAGTIFTNKDKDIQFQTLESITFRYVDFLKGYIEGREIYEVDVVAEAIEVGSHFNVAAQTVTESPMFSTKIYKVENKEQATGGIDKETNLEYLKRMEEFYINRQGGTGPGYKAILIEEFEEIEDVNAQGYKDPYMQRDIVQIPTSDGNGYKSKHIGGMVDLYIKGTRLMNIEDKIPILSPNVKIEVPVKDFVDDSVTISNNTDKTKTPVLKEIIKDPKGKFVVVKIDNTDDVSYDPEKVNEFFVSFRELRNTVPTDRRISVKIGRTEAQLLSPVLEFISAVMEDDSEFIDITNTIDLTKTGEEGTSDEKNVVVVKGDLDVVNGSSLLLKYNMNSTIYNAGILVNSERRRYITSDVLCLPAIPKPINMKIKVDLRPNEELTESRSDMIASSISRYMSSKKLGESVTEMELVEHLNNDDILLDFAKHFFTPFMSFYFPKGDTEFKDFRCGAILNCEDIEYLTVGKVIVEKLVNGNGGECIE